MASNHTKSLARIINIVPGTPVRITFNEVDPTERILCHSILFERDDPNDTGLIYIGVSPTMDRTTLVDVVGILPAPSTGALPSINITLDPGHNALDCRDFWIDADEAGDSILGSYVVG
jgi:hypothetical protein